MAKLLLVLASLWLLFVPAMGQDDDIPEPPQKSTPQESDLHEASSAEGQLPFTVKTVDGGVEVLTYDGNDGLLQPGDIIIWVSTPESDEEAEAVESADSMDAVILARADQNRNVALWVQRVNEEPDWIIVPVPVPAMPALASALPPALPLTVRAAAEGVEVVTYSGTDGLLQPSDIVLWVGTPDSDDEPVAVHSAETMEAAVVARADRNGDVALWVQRGDAEPDWIILSVSGNGLSAPGSNRTGTMQIDARGWEEDDEDDERELYHRQPLIGEKAGDSRKFRFSKDLAEVDMRWCPPGTFTMGSPASERDRNENEDDTAGEGGKPVEVTFTKGFWMFGTEVTQGLYGSMMRAPWKTYDPQQYYHIGKIAFPAVYVSYTEAEEFCTILTRLERDAGWLPADWKYALPTEAQWEYACRAGTTTTYSFGDDESQLGEFAWIEDRFFEGLPPRDIIDYAMLGGMKKPNPWGLYDMHGNVSEWCADRYGDQLVGGPNPGGPSTGSDRVARGGGIIGWDGASGTKPSVYRSACRNKGIDPSARSADRGFRVCLISD